MDFQYFGFSEPVVDGIRRLARSEPSRLQTEVIPLFLSARDILAKTDETSGAALAYGASVVQLTDEKKSSIQCVVLVPTREQALAIAADIEILGAAKGVRTTHVLGGEHVRTTTQRLLGRQIIVGTPGRIADLIENRLLAVEWAKIVVMDGFDRIIDFNALPDARRILNFVATDRQIAIFTSTMARDVANIAKAMLKRPEVIDESAPAVASQSKKQRFIRTKSARKMAVLERILMHPEDPDDTFLVFCNTKQQLRNVDRDLWVKELSVASLSDDLDDAARWKVIDRFRRREIRILLTSDPSKGALEVDHISHVVNFDVPSEGDEYLDRVRRAGRAGKVGLVTTIVGDEDGNAFQRLKKQVEQDIEPLSETLQQQPRSEEADDQRPAVAANASGHGTAPVAAAPDKPVPAPAPIAPLQDMATGNDGDEIDHAESHRVSEADFDLLDDDDVAVSRDADDDGTDESAASSGDDRGGANDQDRGRRGRRRRGRRGGQQKDRPGDVRDGGDRGDRQDAATPARPRESDRQREPDRPRDADKDRGRNRQNEPRHDSRDAQRDPKRDAQRNQPRQNDRRGDRPADRGNRPGPVRRDDKRPQNSSHRDATPNREGEDRRGDRQNGRSHRSRFDYKKWEEEQLNRPVELIEDRWEKGDDVDDVARRPAPDAAAPARPAENRQQDQRGPKNRDQNRRFHGRDQQRRRDRRGGPPPKS